VVQARAAAHGAACACVLRLTPARPRRAAQDLMAWDSLHYQRIAQCGYETEKSHAFFPMLPAVMRATQATGAPRLRCSRAAALQPR
jgi:hypothetical protein